MRVNYNQTNYFNSDIIITGSLSALSGTTFFNTIFTTTSALSVVNTGAGPALYVSQTPGDFDIASFYDRDGVEVLHVGNASGPGVNGKIGINASFPTHELTVRGSISASNDLIVNSIKNSDRIVIGSNTRGILLITGSSLSGTSDTTSFNTGSATGYLSFAANENASAQGYASFAEGQNTVARGIAAHSEGIGTIAYSDYSHAEGNATIAGGAQSHSEGRDTVASGNYSHAEGYLTSTGNRTPFATYTAATKTFTFTNTYSANFAYLNDVGNSNFILKGYEPTVGLFTAYVVSRDANTGDIVIRDDVLGINSADPINTWLIDKSGAYAHAEGDNTQASGNRSHAEGGTTKASGNYSHAEGRDTIASGAYAHAEGRNCNAIGDYAHAEGRTTIASGQYSHAQGQACTSSGIWSDASGFTSLAAGSASFAGGWRANAAQDFTYAWSDGNLGSTSKNAATTRTGQYMVSASGGLFVPGNVGIGTDSVENSLTVVGTISTNKHGSSDGWQNVWSTVNSTSASWGASTQYPTATAFKITNIALGTVGNSPTFCTVPVGRIFVPSSLFIIFDNGAYSPTTTPPTVRVISNSTAANTVIPNFSLTNTVTYAANSMARSALNGSTASNNGLIAIAGDTLQVRVTTAATVAYTCTVLVDGILY